MRGLIGLSLALSLLPSAAGAQAPEELASPTDPPPSAEAPVPEAPASTVQVPPPSEAVPPPSVDPRRVELMSATLEGLAGQDQLLTTIAAITGLVASATLIGLGSYVLADPAFITSEETRLAIGVTGLVVGPLGIAAGISLLAFGVPSGDRLARWRAALDGGMDAEELARFEGELRGEVMLIRQQRSTAVLLAVGLLVGGGLTLAVGGAADMTDDARVIVLAVGGGVAAGGALGIGTAFLDTPVETAWERYQRGELAATGVRVRPFVGPGGAGVAGTF